MTEKEAQKKIAACKKLQGMTVEGVIDTPRFRENMAAYLAEQRETRRAAKASFAAVRKAGMRGYKLPSHACDMFVTMPVDEFTRLYKDVISRRSERPFRERQYIQQLGGQAYNLTIAQYVIEEFPETKDYFFPKHETN